MRLLSRVTLIMQLIGYLLIFQASPARAEASASDFIRLLNSEGDASWVARVRVGGIAQGFFWSNAFLTHQGLTSHYCAPERMAMTDEQVIDILKRHVQASPQKGSLPVGLVLMDALKEILPCPQGARIR
jgi:hypothetical protein